MQSTGYLPAGRQGISDFGSEGWGFESLRGHFKISKKDFSEMEYFVYVLKSEVDGRLYKGQTVDIHKRLNEHNSGKTKSTKGYMPWKLVYFEKFETLEQAVQREKYFKTGSGRELLKKILLQSSL